MLRTNGEIKREIVDQLHWDPRVDAEDIKVDVQNGEVTLFGAVPTHFAKRSAEQDAWSVAGVGEVENAVNVEYRGSIPEATQLKDHIVNILDWDPQIDESTVDVGINVGEVTLSGTVDAFWKKLRARALVQDVRGVTTVIDELTVVPTEPVVDETIAAEIVAALMRNDRVSVDTIDVTVEHGHVTLTGSVPTWAGRNSAYESAVLTAGVIDVDLNLAISS
jgi:osmotically-inducible protein OsmY